MVRAPRLVYAGMAIVLASLAGCGGGGGDGDGSSQPPDLSGVWAGSWQGNDPSPGGFGPVTGTWEAEIHQGTSSASGPSLFLGDIDCIQGQFQTDAGNQSQVTGTVARPGCATVSWALTALNVAAGTAAGSWSNRGTGGGGTLSGERIARLTGPRIRHVFPPGGLPGALVTISGEGLGPLASVDAVRFGTAAAPTPLVSADSQRIVAQVPFAAQTARLSVATSSGETRSPIAFRADVASPANALGASTALSAGAHPAALAVGPDGRRIYIADSASGMVNILHARTLALLPSQGNLAPAAPRSVVASPDGLRIYVAAAGLGVRAMDAALAVPLGSLALTIDATRDNPNGIAISPDGRLLAVSDGASGGTVYFVRTSDLTVTASHAFAAGIAPLGVAFHPSGAPVYVAAADTGGGAGTLQLLDPASGNALSSAAVGSLPTGLAVSPDGSTVFVTNQADGNVSRYNTASAFVSTTAAGLTPTGIAFSPDGSRVFVANQGSNTVSVLSAANGLAIVPAIAVGQAPVAVAVNGQGTTGYVSNLTSPAVQEIGGMRTLTVALAGTGIGRVTSTPAGIDCGTLCEAQFAAGTAISLHAIPDSGSFLAGWSGNCPGGTLTLNANTLCTASFSVVNPPAPPSGGCFIATAAYGSAMAPQVELLRRFRDRHLASNAPGRAFIALYYRYSPPLADAIRPHPAARAAVRAALAPIVWTIAHPQGALAVGLVGGLLLLVRRRRASREPA